jgi:hypothetical protein
MNKFLILLLISLSANSQKYHGYVVTNSNDTIKCKFKVQTNMFNDDIYYPSSGTIVTINNNGEKVKYKPNQLKSYYLQGPNIRNYKFVSLAEDEHKLFYDEIQKGKITLYYTYSGGLSGGGPDSNPVITKDGRFVKIKGNVRKKIGEFISDYPDLHRKWMNSNKFYDITQLPDVIEIYNEHIKN